MLPQQEHALIQNACRGKAQMESLLSLAKQIPQYPDNYPQKNQTVDAEGVNDPEASHILRRLMGGELEGAAVIRQLSGS